MNKREFVFLGRCVKCWVHKVFRKKGRQRGGVWGDVRDEGGAGGGDKWLAGFVHLFLRQVRLWSACQCSCWHLIEQ